MMLRSRKGSADIYERVAKRKMGRNRKIIKTLSEAHIEGRSTEEHKSSVLHPATSLQQASSNGDCISNAEQPSSVAQHSAICQVKNSPSTEVGKCSSAVVPINVTSPEVLSNSNQPADLQPSSVSEDRALLPSSNSSSQMLNNSQTEDLLPSSVSNDSIIDISDVSELEIKSHEPSSNDSKSADADTSDIIIISDSPGTGSVGYRSLKTTPCEISQLQGKKRKISDESGVEILCDVLGPRPKKLQKMGCTVIEKLCSNSTIKEKSNVAVSDTDRKISLLKNENSNDVNNISSKQRAGDGDDVIFVSADDDEVSVINTKEQHKPPQEDVIILDSPPAHSSKDKKPKKLVSKSVTGLIPHYTQHLIDYISLGGKSPATASTSNSTSQLPSGSSNRQVMHEHMPVFKRQKRQDRFDGALRRREMARSANRTVQSDCVVIPISPPQALAESRLSPIGNSTQNSTTQNSRTQNSRTQNSRTQNSRTQNCVPENSVPENSVSENSVPENSVSENSVPVNTVNSAPEVLQSPACPNSAPEVLQSPACPSGSNIYNPNAKDKEEGGLRPVILDGNNIAMGHGKGKFFSWKGLHICIKFFLKRGHEVTAFVPTFRKGRCPLELRPELDDFERSGQVVFTPSRRIEGRLVVPYDDRFIVQCAAELGGVIVSTDNFRDLLNENDSWKETIEKRLLMFTWVGDLLMFPNDPLGRYGPQLEEFLRFPKK